MRIRFALLVTIVGFLIFLIGAKPGLFGMDRSPVVGFIQITVMLIGLAVVCLGGYVSEHLLWRKEIPTIAADIGQRLVSTGYVIAVFSGWRTCSVSVLTHFRECFLWGMASQGYGNRLCCNRNRVYPDVPISQKH